MDGLLQEKHYNLTHYQQRYNWDCGISCILMILSTAQREQLLANFEVIRKEEDFGSSTWTIDLSYILQRFQVRHAYFTKTLGIDPNYMHHSYYAKVIDNDEQRITRKFKDAKARGLRIEQRTVDMVVLLRHLARYGPVIVLTNASLLMCEICKKSVMEKFGYAGHYVVLCGYDMVTDKLFYHNPEVADGHICRCLSSAMDEARKAYGTDEDVLLIFQNDTSTEKN